MTDPGLAAAQLAEARSRAYALLARLLVEGPTRALVERVADTPLAAALPEGLPAGLAAGLPAGTPGAADGGVEAALDTLAASHQALFSLEIFPYASVFMDPEVLTGGPLARAFADECRGAGFAADLPGVSPDHIGGVLGLLAFLCGARADALEDGLTPEAEHLAGRARAALDRWLLPWLAPLSAAVAERRELLWGAVVEMLVALAIDHRAALGGPAAPPALPAPPEDPLGDPATGLKDIARYLTTPCYSGAFLSRADLAALSRGQGTPAGFGGRLQTLNNLLRNAAEYGQLPALTAALSAALERRAAAARGLAEVGLDRAFVAPWLARLEASQALLRALGDAAGDQGRYAGENPS